MCGYIITSKRIEKKNYNSLLSTIYNRGPDTIKTLKSDKFSLFFSRLKIIDLNDRSNQPFFDDYGNFLLFNGEIYNFRELKKKYNLKTNTYSDTEVLFLLIKIKGLKYTLSVIEGMFSFVYYSAKKKQMYAARDHLGQKPLYYYFKNKCITISTNIKSICNIHKIKKFDTESVKYYFKTQGILKTNKTIFKDINSLPAGKYLILKNNKVKINNYFHPADLIDERYYLDLKKKSQTDKIKILEEKILLSVRKHLIADVPVGITLSGGIDSSLIFYYTKKISKDVKTFTGYSSEIEQIPKKIIPQILKKLNHKDHFKIIHKSKNYVKTLLSINKFTYHPSRWGGNVPMSSICKISKKNNVSVLLGGDGVDEICAGYKSINKTDLSSSKAYHSIISPYKNKNINIKHTNDLNNNRSLIMKKINFIKNKKQKFLKLLILEDTSIFLQSCTLPNSDEYSMYNSVELRNPFLDLNLLKFILNLDIESQVDFKTNKNKIIFKELAIKKIGKFIDQDKEGTRNYSKKIFCIKKWNLNNFKILKKFSFLNSLNYNDYKNLFCLFNLESIYCDVNKFTLNLRSYRRNQIKKYEKNISR